MPEVEISEVPPAVRGILDALEASEHEAYLVGGCVRDLLSGQAALDFDVATSASAEQVLAIFPQGIPIGIRHGTVMVPTASGPADVTTFRAGTSLESDLRHRDFTVNAMAWEARRGLIDPCDGRKDLAKGLLRAVGSAADRFAEDPLRALRAARLASTLCFAVDPEVERAMAGTRETLRRVARERVRRELEHLLLGAGVAESIALLRRTGLEETLVPGAREDAGRVIERLPPEKEIRLTAWLRGAHPASVLRRLRFGRRLADRIGRLLALHPVERSARSLRPPDVRRLMKRAGPENLKALFTLREAEIHVGPDDPESRERLARLREAVERVQETGALALRRFDLALDGAVVMEILGCEPGREVGRALAFLTERVLDDPACNTPEQLRALLLEHAGHES